MRPQAGARGPAPGSSESGLGPSRVVLVGLAHGPSVSGHSPSVSCNARRATLSGSQAVSYLWLLHDTVLRPASSLGRHRPPCRRRASVPVRYTGRASSERSAVSAIERSAVTLTALGSGACRWAGLSRLRWVRVRVGPRPPARDSTSCVAERPEPCRSGPSRANASGSGRDGPTSPAPDPRPLLRP